jgi:hypothetical protein
MFVCGAAGFRRSKKKTLPTCPAPEMMANPKFFSRKNHREAVTFRGAYDFLKKSQRNEIE